MLVLVGQTAGHGRLPAVTSGDLRLKNKGFLLVACCDGGDLVGDLHIGSPQVIKDHIYGDLRSSTFI